MLEPGNIHVRGVCAMSATNAIRSESDAARQLRAVMKGKVVRWGDDGYARAREIWNGAVQSQPALFALCKNSDDVQSAVRYARKHNIPLSVRGGGHDWAGRALRHDGLVIDLSHIRRVDIDPDTSVATIQGGATAADVISASAPHGLVATTGLSIAMTGKIPICSGRCVAEAATSAW